MMTKKPGVPVRTSLPLTLDKTVIVERYNNYGASYDSHVRAMGGQHDQWVSHYLAPQLTSGNRLLDVASGDGFATSQLDASQVSIVAMDISDRLLEVARSRRPNIVNTVIADFDERFPFEDRTFDYTICVSALEFCADLAFTLSEMFRVTKRNGGILFTIDRLDVRHSVQREEIYIHDPRGFFSRRYPVRTVLQLLKRMGATVEQQGTHKAYRLEGEWVHYEYLYARMA